MANNEDWWDKVEGEPLSVVRTGPGDRRLYLLSRTELLEACRTAAEPFIGTLNILVHVAAQAGLLDLSAHMMAVSRLSYAPDDMLDAYLRAVEKRRRQYAIEGRPDWLDEPIEGDTPDDADDAGLPKPTHRPNFTLH